MPAPKNVLGQALQACSIDPMTGYYRNGSCQTDDMDTGTHVVCARVTAPFLAFSKARGNDLTTPRPGHRFPGLKPGDQWCLCALRWKEAQLAGVAPPLVLAATHERMLDYASIEELRSHAVPAHDPKAANPTDN